MKLLNNTTGNLHYDTSYTVDGKAGGDCGDLAPNSPTLNFSINANMTNFSIVIRCEDITYADMTDDMFLTVSSSILTSK